MGNLGDMVNKTKLYDKRMEQPRLATEPKISRVLVDYAAKMERVLVEMRVLFIELQRMKA